MLFPPLSAAFSKALDELLASTSYSLALHAYWSRPLRSTQEQEHHHEVLHLHAADEVPIEADGARVAHRGADATCHGHQQRLSRHGEQPRVIRLRSIIELLAQLRKLPMPVFPHILHGVLAFSSASAASFSSSVASVVTCRTHSSHPHTAHTHTSHSRLALLVRVVAGRRVCAEGPRGFPLLRFVTPGRSPIVICSQSVLPVRVGDGAARVRDGAAVVIHRQRVDCARIEDGAAVAICSQDVVPCHVGHSCPVASCCVMSSQGMSCCDVMPCHVASCHLCHVMSCHVMSCHVTSRHVTSRRVMSRHVMSRNVMPCHVVATIMLKLMFKSSLHHCICNNLYYDRRSWTS